jgi:hypothetical protein
MVVLKVAAMEFYLVENLDERKVESMVEMLVVLLAEQ